MNTERLNHSNIQVFFEEHIQQLTGLKLINFDIEINGTNVQTLAFDDLNQCFVIFEYINNLEQNLLETSKRYFNCLKDNKGIFTSEYVEKFNNVLKRDEVNWENCKVIFVAKNFSYKQSQEVFNENKLVIELLQIKIIDDENLNIQHIKKNKFIA